MVGIEEFAITWLTALAHHPIYLYVGVVSFLFASSFGLPIPEEVVLITCGLVAGVALAESAQTGLPPTIHPVAIAAVCFAAVFLSDALVFWLGRRFGFSLLRKKPFSKVITDNAISHVEKWTNRYGALACGVFRFTPGIRFIGHFTCGASKVSWPTFIAVDGFAAFVSVPTQVLLLAYYGDEILAYVKQFKLAVLTIAVVAIGLWLIRKRFRAQKLQQFDSGGDAAA